jgi:hypothetical protein
MGWGRMLLMGNVGQQLDIGDVENAVHEMQSAFLENQQVDLKQERSIAELRRENQELKLYLATVVRLLVSKGVLKPEEVEATVNAIEQRR